MWDKIVEWIMIITKMITWQKKKEEVEVELVEVVVDPKRKYKDLV